MSVVPVREAIRRLEAEGAGDVRAQRRRPGGRDRPIEYRLHDADPGIVEGAATALAAPHLTAADLAERPRDQRPDARVPGRLRPRPVHPAQPGSSTASCPSPARTRSILDLVDRGWPGSRHLRGSTFGFVPGRAHESVAEHEAILALMSTGAARRRSRAARRHRSATLDALPRARPYLEPDPTPIEDTMTDTAHRTHVPRTCPPASSTTSTASSSTRSAARPSTCSTRCRTRPTPRAAAGKKADIDRAVAAAPARLQSTARGRGCCPASGPRVLHRIADIVESRDARLAELETFDTGLPITQALRPGPPRGRELPLLRRPDRRPGRRRLQGARPPAQLRQPQADRRRRAHHAVEHAVHAGVLEARPRRSRPATPSCSSPPSSPRSRRRCGPASSRRPGCRRACSTSSTASARRPATPWSSTRTCRSSRSPARAAPGRSIFAQRRRRTSRACRWSSAASRPRVVFADADLDAAIDATLFGVFSLNGERCTAGSAASSSSAPVYDEFVRALRRAGRARIVVGDPHDPKTEVGALVHPEHYAKVHALRRDRQGARAGSSPAAAGPTGCAEGNYVAPTVFADVAAGRADLPGGDLRPGRRDHPVRHRRGGARAGQRHQVRPRRLHLDQRPEARAQLRAGRRGRAWCG